MKTSKSPVICFAAGKSGGHIIPCLTLMQRLPEHTDIIFFSTTSALDMKLLEAYARRIRLIPLPLARSYATWYKKFFFILCLIRSFFIALRILRNTRPDKIITTGGMISLPVVLAGYWLGIERELFELNAVPGKAIALLSRWATRVMVCFPQAAQAFKQVPVSVVPYPVRFTLTKHATQSSVHPLYAARKTVLVLGGSQGSFWLNNALKTWIKQTNMKSDIACIHQCGTDVASLQALYHAHGVPAHVFTYEDNLQPYYEKADLIICRAGAGTLFEAIHFRKKMLVIPLETDYTDHQKDNALALAQMHPTLITVIRQKECMANASLFGRTVEHLLGNTSVCAQPPESHKNGHRLRIP